MTPGSAGRSLVSCGKSAAKASRGASSRVVKTRRKRAGRERSMTEGSLRTRGPTASFEVVNKPVGACWQATRNVEDGCRPESPASRLLHKNRAEFSVAKSPHRFLCGGEMIKAKRLKKLPEHVNAALAKKKGPVSKFIALNYRHFNAAALLDTAKGYETHLQPGAKMLVP